MSISRWNGATGDWSNAADWSNGVPNSPNANAQITAAGAYTVTISGGEQFTVGSLNLNAAGATLSVVGSNVPASLHVGGAINLNAGTLNLAALSNVDTGSLTIGAKASVTASIVTNLSVQQTLTNNGQIVELGGKHGLQINAATFLNNGSLDVTGFLFATTTTFTNAATGVIDVRSTGVPIGTVAQIGGAFKNLGKISIAAGSALDVFGSYSLADLGSIANNGSLALGGTLSNQGMTLTLGSGVLAGNVSLGGVIVGGVVVGGDHSTQISSATLDGVTYQGTLAVGGAMRILDGLTVTSAGGGAGEVLLGFGAQLEFSGNQTLDNATVMGGVLQGSSRGNGLFVDPNTTLTLGAHLTINDADSNGAIKIARIGTSSANTGTTLINNGTIEATAAAGRLFIDPASLVNNGTIAVSNNGEVEISVETLQTTVLSGTGQITIASGGTALLGATAAGQTVTFEDATGKLQLFPAGAFGGAISGLRSGDTIDLLFRAATTASVNASDQLVITDKGAAVATLQLAGDFSHTVFTVASDGNGGSTISVTAGAASVPPALAVHAMAQAMAGLSGHGGAPVAPSFHNGGAARVNMLAVPAFA